MIPDKIKSEHKAANNRQSCREATNEAWASREHLNLLIKRHLRDKEMALNIEEQYFGKSET